MIVDTLSNSRLYGGLSRRMDAAFAWIAKTDLGSLSPGEYPISKGVHAIVQEYSTAAEKDKKYDAHRKFIDIQCVARGAEMTLVRPLASLETETSYDDGNDIIFLHPAEGGSRIIVTKGMFAVFFPEDAHMPCVSIDSPLQVLKVVVKVAV